MNKLSVTQVEIDEEIIFNIDFFNKKTEETNSIKKTYSKIILLYKELEDVPNLIIPFFFNQLDQKQIREENPNYLELLKFKVERFLLIIYNLEYLKDNHMLLKFFYDKKCDINNAQLESPTTAQLNNTGFLNNLVGLIPQLKSSPVNAYVNLPRLPEYCKELDIAQIENSQVYIANLDDHYSLTLENLQNLIDCEERLEAGITKLGTLSLSALHGQYRLGNMGSTPVELTRFHHFLERFSMLIDDLNSIQSRELSNAKLRIILAQYKLSLRSIKKTIINNQSKLVELNSLVKECHKKQDKILSIMDDECLEPTPELIEARRQEEEASKAISKGKDSVKETNKTLLRDLKSFEVLKVKDLQSSIRSLAECQLETHRKKLEKLKQFFSIPQTPEPKPTFNISPIIDSDTPSFHSYPSSTVSIRSYESLGIGPSSGASKATNSLTNGIPFYPLDID